MKKYILSALFAVSLLFTQQVYAQESSLLHFMNTTPQAMRSNPANLPDSVQMFFGVPFLSNISVGAAAPVSWSNIFTKRNDGLYVNSDISSKISNTDRLYFDFNYDIFTFGARYEKHFITAGLAVKGYGDATIPADAVTLLVKGNTAFMNKPCEMDASLFGVAYAELAVGYGYEIDKNWTVGGRVKLLGGLAGAYSESIKATLTTDSESYDLYANTDILVKTANFADGNAGKNMHNIFKNLGVGFDLGVYYKTPSVEGLEIGLSLLDWGFINWNGGVKDRQGTNNNQPVSFIGITDLKSGGDLIQTVLDTLKGQLSLNTVDGGSFTTKLQGSILLSASYNFTPNDRVGFLFRTNALQNFERTGVSIMYNRLIGDWLSISAGNNFRFSQHWFNPSVALNVKASTLQFYLAVENISGFYLRDMRSLSAQLGLAIVLY